MQNPIENEIKGFDTFYEAQQRSPIIRKIFRETLGFGDLDEAFAPFSFVSLEDLQKITGLLNLSKSGVLADIGCGNGCIGLWLAQHCDAQLFGIDTSASAVELAKRNAEKLDPLSKPEFQTGSLDSTGLASESVDAVISTDAVWLAVDQQKALIEFLRILKKGGRLVFTSWEQHIPMPFVKQPVKDIVRYSSNPDLRSCHTSI